MEADEAQDKVSVACQETVISERTQAPGDHLGFEGKASGKETLRSGVALPDDGN